MDNSFKPNEKLYRAVYPPEVAELFWRRDGSVSSAAFADAKGLSVDRGDFRPEKDVISIMKKNFSGRVVSLYVRNCTDVGAVLRYLPSARNPYHSEIHGSQDVVLLSKQQRYHLSRKAKIVS